jgi:predicted nucleotidyltransferase
MGAGGTEGMNLREYAARRDDILNRVTSAFSADDRIRAAWLSGSFGRQEHDAWSDLDLHVAVADEHFEAVLRQRQALYRAAGVPILIQEEMQSDSRPGARFQLVVYPGPVEVDWNIGAESQAVLPLNFQMLVERAHLPVYHTTPLSPEAHRARAQHWLTFFWAMVPIGIKLCGRRETRRAVNQLDLQTRAYIALWRLAGDASTEVPNAANPLLEPQLQESIPRVGPTITPEAILAAMATLAERVRELHPALERLGVSAPDEIATQITEFHDLAVEVLAHDSHRPRPYR